MPLLPILCLLFSCLSLWIWYCAVVVYLFYFQWSILLTGHLQLGLSSLVCIWFGCQILGTLVWTIEILIKSQIDFSQRFVQVVNNLFLLLTFTPVGNIQIFVGRMWLPGTLFLCWSTLTLLEWDTLILFQLFFQHLFWWSVLCMPPHQGYWHHIEILLLCWGQWHSNWLSMPCTVLFLFLSGLLDVVVAIRSTHSFSSVLKVVQSFVIVSMRTYAIVPISVWSSFAFCGDWISFIAWSLSSVGDMPCSMIEVCSFLFILDFIWIISNGVLLRPLLLNLLPRYHPLYPWHF